MNSRIRRWIIEVAVLCVAIGTIRAADVINMAPTIEEFGDVVIGDAENSSGMNVFVFPDVVSLKSIVADDLTSPTGIRWSYSSQGNVYMINGADPVDPAVDDLVSPPLSKRIDLNTDPLDPVQNPKHLTLRDNLRSPITEAGGAGPYSDRYGSTASGPRTIIDSRVVTLYASDGSTVSLSNARSFIVYTCDNGYDLLSRRPYYWTFPIDSRYWTFNQSSGTAAGSNTTAGMCITGRNHGTDDASWTSHYPTLNFAMNTVLEVRLTVTTNNTTAFQTPMWELIYDNISADGKHGQNEYGGEIFFLDNEGGANSPIAEIGRSEFVTYLMPIQMQTPQFTNSNYGFATPALDPNNDMRLSFRMMGRPGYDYFGDPETVCIQKIQTRRHDLADMTVDSTAYSADRFANAETSPNVAGAWQNEWTGQLTETAFNSDGSVTIRPTDNWDLCALIMFRPGDSKIDFLASPPNYLDNYPIPWIADSLYYIEFLLSAPDAWAELNGPDVIRVGADTLTGEIVCDNFAVPNTPDMSKGVVPTMIRGVSMPRAGAPQKYGCFFYTHSVTKTTIPDGQRWRPRFEILASSNLSPMGRKTNLGGLTVHGVTVKKVHFSR